MSVGGAVDTALARRAAAGDPVPFALVGAGFMGRGIVHQVLRHVPGLRLPVVCNRTVGAAVAAYRQAGVEPVVVGSAGHLDAVVAGGGHAVTDDPAVVCAATGIDVVVEATGHVAHGAAVAAAAIAAGKHVVLLNAEVDATLGPLLRRRAEAAGVILTGCDGDQPGVQLNLLRWVSQLGLTPLVAGNVKGLQDRYRTPATQAGFAARWGQTPQMVTSFADGTKISMEQALVANATGLTIERRGMIGLAHPGHVDELIDRYDLDRLRELGGIVDYVVGARPSPGVYVLAEARDDVQRLYLDYGKLGPGPVYPFSVPQHLTVLEVPISVARVALLGDTVIAAKAGPVVEVVTVAKTDLDAGTVLDGIGGFHAYGVCETYPVARAEGMLPMGLAEGCRLRRAVRRDQVITRDDVSVPASPLAALRAEQDRRYPG